MSVHILCSNCGREIQMRTEVLAKNWRASGLTRKQYIDSYICRTCKTGAVSKMNNERSLMDTSAFRSFIGKIKTAYKKCVQSGMSRESIGEFTKTVKELMTENKIPKYEFVISNGMLTGIKFIDFPVFGTVQAKLI